MYELRTRARTGRGIARAYIRRYGWPGWSTREEPMPHRVWAVLVEGEVWQLVGVLGTARRPTGQTYGPMVRVVR